MGSLIPVEGGLIYSETRGEGRPVVLIHAGVANLRMWDRQVESLSAAGYRAVTYDARGFGRSETEHVAFSNREDVAAVLDYFDIPSATVVGASRGGFIGLDFTLERPDRVDSLVVVAGGIGGYSSPEAADDSVWERAEALWKAREWEALSDFETRWWVDGPGQSTSRVVPTVRRLVHEWILTNYKAEKEEGVPQPLDPPAEGRLGEVDVPTLIMVGDLDDRGIQDACRKLADDISDARLELFEGVAHMINLERPDRFDGALLGFLAESLS